MTQVLINIMLLEVIMAISLGLVAGSAFVVLQGVKAWRELRKSELRSALDKSRRERQQAGLVIDDRGL